MRLTKDQAADPKYRTRNWQSILYPDSAPEDWLDRLRGAGVQAFVSPLHKDDLNGDGQPKKPHYHIVVMYANKKAFWQVDTLFEEVGALHGFASDGKSQFLPCNDLRIAVRYLCHLDNPEKAPYRREDVISIGGADFDEIATLPSDDDQVMSEIIQWLYDYKCYSYRQLITYARDNQRQWFRYLCHKGSRHVYQIIKSSLWEREHFGKLLSEREVLYYEGADGNLYNRATGEVMQNDQE